MTDWKVRIPGRQAVGPVSTELLIRDIRAGRIPPDIEVVEVGSDAWTPLASVDEFYDALGLGDLRTAVWEPLRCSSSPPPGHEEDDQAQTRLVERRSWGVEDVDEEGITRLIGQAAGTSAEDEGDVTKRVTGLPSKLPQASPVISAQKGASGRTTARGQCAPRGDEQSRAVTSSTAFSERRRRYDLNAGDMAGVTRRGQPNHQSPDRRSPGSLGQHTVFAHGGKSVPAPRVNRPYGAAESTRSSARAGIRASDDPPPVPAGDNATVNARRPQKTLPGISPPDHSPAWSPLLDADEGDEDSGTGDLYSKARKRFPGLRSLVEPVVAQGLPGHPPVVTHGTLQTVRIDRTDEPTGPALRLQRAYARTRAALVILLALLTIAVMALIALWVRR
jgi:hypothetical protein